MPKIAITSLSGAKGGDIDLPAQLQPLRITNPDAPRTDYCVKVQFGGESVWAVPVLYSAFMHAGYLSHDLLLSLRKLGSPLQGHPDRRAIPALEASTGSLGNGLSIGLGSALAARLDAIRAQDLERRRRVIDGYADGGAGSVRPIVDGRELLSFCGNDYLGLARDARGLQHLEHLVGHHEHRLLARDHRLERRPREVLGHALGGGAARGGRARVAIPLGVQERLAQHRDRAHERARVLVAAVGGQRLLEL